ncbi:transcriptional regulator LysR family [Patulibacter medicamentivorans]|uniref:Transcriptional regulator LysR family n=1 Tax=Patulibacter medicamentivorans TaxID=1097667 RepID=H0E0E9_9ACTN|nr:LysR family transcriptional regulator [Patulibacter medicamentivorans]EHN12854.1 transcriptional regulator LysR family [Patulibacter medicamentivorans]
MTLRQLEYFVAVVDEGSISRAAERVRVAQPSVSQQIRALEQELGGALLERLPRSTRLTPLGRVFEPQARSVLLAAETAREVVRGELRQPTGQLEIATVRSMAGTLLPGPISRWRAAHPGVTIRLHEFPHRAELEERFQSGVADVAIGPRPQRWDGEIHELGWEEFVVVLPADDPELARPRISLASLADRDWVLYASEHGLSELIAFAFAHAGYIAAPAVRTSQVDAAARLAAAGLGPAMVPIGSVPHELADLARPLQPAFGRAIAAYTRETLSPLAATYVASLREGSWPPVPDGALIAP